MIYYSDLGLDDCVCVEYQPSADTPGFEITVKDLDETVWIPVSYRTRSRFK